MAMNSEVDIPSVDTMTVDDTAFAPILTRPHPEDTSELWRNRQRSSRRRAVQARSIDIKRIPKGELALDRLLCPSVEVDRPVTRGDCVAHARPCLFVSCKHHLYLDVSPRTGSIKLNFPDLDVSEMTESCVLDIADRGGTLVEEVGTIMNLTRERIRQVEVQALANIVALDGARLREFDDEGPARGRRLPIFVDQEDGEGAQPASTPSIRPVQGRGGGDISRLVESIVAFVERHSCGVRAEQLRAELGIAKKGEWLRSVEAALASKRVIKKGRNRATTYFAATGDSIPGEVPGK